MKKKITATVAAALLVLTPGTAMAQDRYSVTPPAIPSSALSSDPGAQLEAQGVPATQTLINQFLCHVVFAPFKNPWNLEPDRPVVSPSSYVLTFCNP